MDNLKDPSDFTLFSNDSIESHLTETKRPTVETQFQNVSKSETSKLRTSKSLPNKSSPKTIGRSNFQNSTNIHRGHNLLIPISTLKDPVRIHTLREITVLNSSHQTNRNSPNRQTDMLKNDKDELSQIKIEYSAAKMKIKELRKVKEGFCIEIGKMQKEIEELKKTNNELQKTCKTKDEEIDNLKKTSKEKDDQVKFLQSVNEEVVKDVNTLNSNLVTLSNKMEYLQSKYDETCNIKKQNQSDIEDSEKAITCEDARLIGLISTFLLPFFMGTSLKDIYSYTRRFVDISEVKLEQLISRCGAFKKNNEGSWSLNVHNPADYICSKIEPPRSTDNLLESKSPPGYLQSKIHSVQSDMKHSQPEDNLADHTSISESAEKSTNNLQTIKVPLMSSSSISIQSDGTRTKNIFACSNASPNISTDKSDTFSVVKIAKNAAPSQSTSTYSTVVDNNTKVPQKIYTDKTSTSSSIKLNEKILPFQTTGTVISTVVDNNTKVPQKIFINKSGTSSSKHINEKVVPFQTTGTIVSNVIDITEVLQKIFTNKFSTSSSINTNEKILPVQTTGTVISTVVDNNTKVQQKIVTNKSGTLNSKNINEKIVPFQTTGTFVSNVIDTTEVPQKIFTNKFSTSSSINTNEKILPFQTTGTVISTVVDNNTKVPQKIFTNKSGTSSFKNINEKIIPFQTTGTFVSNVVDNVQQKLIFTSSNDTCSTPIPVKSNKNVVPSPFSHNLSKKDEVSLKPQNNSLKTLKISPLKSNLIENYQKIVPVKKSSKVSMHKSGTSSCVKLTENIQSTGTVEPNRHNKSKKVIPNLGFNQSQNGSTRNLYNLVPVEIKSKVDSLQSRNDEKIKTSRKRNKQKSSRAKIKKLKKYIREKLKFHISSNPEIQITNITDKTINPIENINNLPENRNILQKENVSISKSNSSVTSIIQERMESIQNYDENEPSTSKGISRKRKNSNDIDTFNISKLKKISTEKYTNNGILKELNDGYDTAVKRGELHTLNLPNMTLDVKIFTNLRELFKNLLQLTPVVNFNFTIVSKYYYFVLMKALYLLNFQDKHLINFDEFCQSPEFDRKQKSIKTVDLNMLVKSSETCLDCLNFVQTEIGKLVEILKIQNISDVSLFETILKYLKQLHTSLESISLSANTITNRECTNTNKDISVYTGSLCELKEIEEAFGRKYPISPQYVTKELLNSFKNMYRLLTKLQVYISRLKTNLINKSDEYFTIIKKFIKRFVVNYTTSEIIPTNDVVGIPKITRCLNAVIQATKVLLKMVNRTEIDYKDFLCSTLQYFVKLQASVKKLKLNIITLDELKNIDEIFSQNYEDLPNSKFTINAQEDLKKMYFIINHLEARIVYIKSQIKCFPNHPQNYNEILSDEYCLVIKSFLKRFLPNFNVNVAPIEHDEIRVTIRIHIKEIHKYVQQFTQHSRLIASPPIVTYSIMNDNIKEFFLKAGKHLNKLVHYLYLLAKSDEHPNKFRWFKKTTKSLTEAVNDYEIENINNVPSTITGRSTSFYANEISKDDKATKHPRTSSSINNNISKNKIDRVLNKTLEMTKYGQKTHLISLNSNDNVSENVVGNSLDRTHEYVSIGNNILENSNNLMSEKINNDIRDEVLKNQTVNTDFQITSKKRSISKSDPNKYYVPSKISKISLETKSATSEIKLDALKRDVNLDKILYSLIEHCHKDRIFVTKIISPETWLSKKVIKQLKYLYIAIKGVYLSFSIIKFRIFKMRPKIKPQFSNNSEKYYIQLLHIIKHFISPVEKIDEVPLQQYDHIQLFKNSVQLVKENVDSIIKSNERIEASFRTTLINLTTNLSELLPFVNNFEEFAKNYSLEISEVEIKNIINALSTSLQNDEEIFTNFLKELCEMKELFEKNYHNISCTVSSLDPVKDLLKRLEEIRSHTKAIKNQVVNIQESLAIDEIFSDLSDEHFVIINNFLKCLIPEIEINDELLINPEFIPDYEQKIKDLINCLEKLTESINLSDDEMIKDTKQFISCTLVYFTKLSSAISICLKVASEFNKNISNKKHKVPNNVLDNTSTIQTKFTGSLKELQQLYIMFTVKKKTTPEITLSPSTVDNIKKAYNILRYIRKNAVLVKDANISDEFFEIIESFIKNILNLKDDVVISKSLTTGDKRGFLLQYYINQINIDNEDVFVEFKNIFNSIKEYISHLPVSMKILSQIKNNSDSNIAEIEWNELKQDPMLYNPNIVNDLKEFIIAYKTMCEQCQNITDFVTCTKAIDVIKNIFTAFIKSDTPIAILRSLILLLKQIYVPPDDVKFDKLLSDMSEDYFVILKTCINKFTDCNTNEADDEVNILKQTVLSLQREAENPNKEKSLLIIKIAKRMKTCIRLIGEPVTNLSNELILINTEKDIVESAKPFFNCFKKYFDNLVASVTTLNTLRKILLVKNTSKLKSTESSSSKSNDQTQHSGTDASNIQTQPTEIKTKYTDLSVSKNDSSNVNEQHTFPSNDQNKTSSEAEQTEIETLVNDNQLHKKDSKTDSIKDDHLYHLNIQNQTNSEVHKKGNCSVETKKQDNLSEKDKNKNSQDESITEDSNKEKNNSNYNKVNYYDETTTDLNYTEDNIDGSIDDNTVDINYKEDNHKDQNNTTSINEASVENERQNNKTSINDKSNVLYNNGDQIIKTSLNDKSTVDFNYKADNNEGQNNKISVNGESTSRSNYNEKQNNKTIITESRINLNDKKCDDIKFDITNGLDLQDPSKNLKYAEENLQNILRVQDILFDSGKWTNLFNVKYTQHQIMCMVKIKFLINELHVFVLVLRHRFRTVQDNPDYKQIFVNLSETYFNVFHKFFDILSGNKSGDISENCKRARNMYKVEFDVLHKLFIKRLPKIRTQFEYLKSFTRNKEKVFQDYNEFFKPIFQYLYNFYHSINILKDIQGSISESTESTSAPEEGESVDYDDGYAELDDSNANEESETVNKSDSHEYINEIGNVNDEFRFKKPQKPMSKKQANKNSDSGQSSKNSNVSKTPKHESVDVIDNQKYWNKSGIPTIKYGPLSISMSPRSDTIGDYAKNTQNIRSELQDLFDKVLF